MKMKRSLKLITLVGSALLASTVLFTSCANSSGGGSSDAKSEPTQPAAAPSAPSGTSGTSGTSGGGSSGGGGNENTLPNHRLYRYFLICGTKYLFCR